MTYRSEQEEDQYLAQETGASPGTGYSLRLLLKSSTIYSISDLGLKIIGFFLIPLYTRALTPDDYGIIGYTDAVTQVLNPVVGLGLVSCLPMLYYFYEGEERKRLISTLVNFTFLFGFGMTALFLIAGRPICARYAGQVDFNPYIVLTLMTLFAMVFYYLPTSIFNMQERATAYAGYSLGLSLLMVCANITLILFLRMGALGALWARLIVGITGMLTVMVVIRKSYRPVIDRDKLWALLALALPALPHLLSSTVWRFADRFFLVSKTTLAAAGKYSLGVQFSSVVLIAMGGVTTALNPLFYRRANQNDPTLPADWARLSALFIFGAAWISLGLMVVGPELVQILTPPRYHAIGTLLPVLAVGHALTGLYWLFSPGIGHTRKMWVYPVTSFPTMAINLFLNAYLVPRYGAQGSAWAMMIAAFVQCAIFGYFSMRYYPVPHQYSQITKVLVYCTLIFAVSRVQLFESFWGAFGFKLIILALLPLTLFGSGFFTRREIESVKESMRRIAVLFR